MNEDRCDIVGLKYTKIYQLKDSLTLATFGAIVPQVIIIMPQAMFEKQNIINTIHLENESPR